MFTHKRGVGEHKTVLFKYLKNYLKEGLDFFVKPQEMNIGGGYKKKDFSLVARGWGVRKWGNVG